MAAAVDDDGGGGILLLTTMWLYKYRRQKGSLYAASAVDGKN